MQALCAHQGEVNGRGGNQQALIGADVGGRLAAPNVLFPRLQGEREAGALVAVHGASGDAPGELTNKPLPGADEAEGRPAGGHRNPQRLAVAAGDVGAVAAPFARRLEHCQRQRIHHRNRQRAVGAGPAGDFVHRLDHAEEVGLLHDHGLRRHGLQGIQVGRAIGGEAGRFQHHALIAGDVGGGFGVERMAGAGQGHAVFLRVRRGSAPPSALRRPYGHQHGFAERRAAVVDRGIGNVHAGQGGHHRLVFVDELQRALAGLGLVRRVGGHELAAAGHVPDGGGNVVVVAAGA